MKIYTGRGDKGETDLRSGGRVSKNSPRIEAYGSIDELNASLGEGVAMIRSEDRLSDIKDDLVEVQNLLFIAQADLADREKKGDLPRVKNDEIDWLESRIDSYQEELDPLESFVIPGGCRAGAKIHTARTIARRAERRTVSLAEEEEVGEIVKFLNRLSDFLFQIARLINKRKGIREENPTY